MSILIARAVGVKRRLQTGTGVRVKYRLKVKSIMHTGNNMETADYILFKYILYYCHY